MIIDQCPFCGGENCERRVVNDNYTFFKCSETAVSAYIGETVLNSDDNTKRKLLNLMFEFLLRQPMCGDKYWRFFCNTDYKLNDHDEDFYVNLSDIPYPSSLSEKADRVLLNLYKINPEYSDVFSVADTPYRAVFSNSETEDSYLDFLLVLCDLGYLKDIHEKSYRISSKGFQRIEELTREGNALNQGFIAMSFAPEVGYIAESIKKAISGSDYLPMIINEKEHNNQIVPEILYEIDNSRFLVMDVTKQNYGAYYEAGYALGKGKEVIICCKKEVLDAKENRPHFDILQKSLVIWDDEEDLVQKLMKRIKSTVK